MPGACRRQGLCGWAGSGGPWGCGGAGAAGSVEGTSRGGERELGHPGPPPCPTHPVGSY